MKSGHAVKMVYDRMEDLAATTKRHPSRVRHRTALDRDGKLLAIEIDLYDRRRRLLHALSDGAFARHAALDRTVPLPECARAITLLGHEYDPLRRISRLWRAAGHLRHGTAYG